MSDEENSPSPKKVVNGGGMNLIKAFQSSKVASTHPKYIDMVTEAVKQLDEKKGASVIAIKHWMIHSYPNLEPNRMKMPLKLAIQRGVETGLLVRPKKSEGLAALAGRYKLGKPPKPTAIKKKKKLAKVAGKTAGKSRKKSPVRRKSSQDVFDYEDEEGDDEDDVPSPPIAKKKTAAKAKPKTAARQRSASASATPKPRGSKSKNIRRVKSQSPAPTKHNKTTKKPAAKKSPAKRSTSKSPAKKPKAKAKTKATTSKSAPAAGGKTKKAVPKKTNKTPTKKSAKTGKKKEHKD